MSLVCVALSLVLAGVIVTVRPECEIHADGVVSGWKADNLRLVCSCPAQWLTVARLLQWRTRCCCQSQGPHTAVWPCLPVMKALCGGVETTALFVELMDCGEDPPWSVKVTQHKPKTVALLMFALVALYNYSGSFISTLWPCASFALRCSWHSWPGKVCLFDWLFRSS